MSDVINRFATIRDQLLQIMWRGIDPFADFHFRPEQVDIQGWSGSGHPWLAKAVQDLRPHIILEVGVWKGASTLYMAETMRRAGMNGVVVAVDTWLGSSEHWQNQVWFDSLRVQEGRPTIQQIFMNNVMSMSLQNYIIPLPLDSVNAARLLTDIGVKIDVVHIDAGHDYESVTNDLASWWPLLRTGGILIGDDYHRDGELWPEVAAAFDFFTDSHNLPFDHSRPKIRIRKPDQQPQAAVDQAKMDIASEILGCPVPDTLDYTGEFGAELVLFLPFCSWLSKVGLLKNRRIQTYFGMRCFYDNLDCLEVVEKPQPRTYVPPKHRPRWLPIKNEHTFDELGCSALHHYPDLRGKFSRMPLLPEIGRVSLPILIVHNKHNNEWGEGAINHISLATLDILFQTLKNEFTIVYIQHGMSLGNPDFSDDHNNPLPFEDRALLNDHPEVLCFDDLYVSHRAEGGHQDINTFKNVLYSRCHHFISSQGGGAHHIAMFSGSLLVILHRRGSEEYLAYNNGYYGFMASVPPIRAICRTEADLVGALPLFFNSAITDGRVLLNTGDEWRLAKLSPWTIARRR